jgi:hypothetical protein
MTRAVLIALTVVGAAAYAYWSQAEIDRLRRSEALAKQNISALSDTLRTVENEKGEIESSRLVLVMERDDLKLSNLRLSDRLGRISGRLEVALSALAEVESRDTTNLVLIDSELVDSAGSWSWTYDPVLPVGNRLLVEGRSGFVSDSAWTEITRHLVAVDLVVAIRKREDGLREAVAHSTWPGLRVNIEGAILEPDMVLPPKRRSWTLPFGVGFAAGVVLWELAR